ncbi:PTS transporter subunit EIIC [Vibrio chagasii]|nr:PTS transporter subunit EIIC [Vibrio chagasii]
MHTQLSLKTRLKHKYHGFSCVKAPSFLTGITEPIEFSFLFVAPVLYAIHAY